MLLFISFSYFISLCLVINHFYKCSSSACFFIFMNKMNSYDKLNQLLYSVHKTEPNSPERSVCCNMCDCALIFDGVRGCFCLKMWNASSMCMFEATLWEFPPSFYICVLWILKVQYVSVLGVLIRSRTTQAWEDGS